MPVFDLFIQDYDIKNEETIFIRFLIGNVLKTFQYFKYTIIHLLFVIRYIFIYWDIFFPVFVQYKILFLLKMIKKQ